MQKAAIFLGFVPWIVFTSSPGRARACGPHARVACVLASSSPGRADRAAPGRSSVLEVTGAVFFVVLGVLAPPSTPRRCWRPRTGPSDRQRRPRGRRPRAAGGRPAVHRAVRRKETPREYWHSPTFKGINRRISAIWGPSSPSHALCEVADPSWGPRPDVFNWCRAIVIVRREAVHELIARPRPRTGSPRARRRHRRSGGPSPMTATAPHGAPPPVDVGRPAPGRGVRPGDRRGRRRRTSRSSASCRAALDGAYLRNGPNPRFTPDRPLRLPARRRRDGAPRRPARREGRVREPLRAHPRGARRGGRGRALWARAHRPATCRAPTSSDPSSPGTTRPLPDINVVRHGGRLLALAESDAAVPARPRPRHGRPRDLRRLAARRRSRPTRRSIRGPARWSCSATGCRRRS